MLTKLIYLCHLDKKNKTKKFPTQMDLKLGRKKWLVTICEVNDYL